MCTYVWPMNLPKDHACMLGDKCTWIAVTSERCVVVTHANKKLQLIRLTCTHMHTLVLKNKTKLRVPTIFLKKHLSILLCCQFSWEIIAPFATYLQHYMFSFHWVFREKRPLPPFFLSKIKSKKNSNNIHMKRKTGSNFFFL